MYMPEHIGGKVLTCCSVGYTGIDRNSSITDQVHAKKETYRR